MMNNKKMMNDMELDLVCGGRSDESDYVILTDEMVYDFFAVLKYVLFG